jgi:5-formyltetrahydrofolate cyclo-ligase
MDTKHTASIDEQKKIFRARVLRERSKLAAEQRREKSERIVERLFLNDAVMNFQSWFVYVSFKSEVETQGLIRRLLAAGKMVSVPVIDVISNSMTASLIADLDLDLAPGCMGILEPKADRLHPVACGGIDIVLAPGAAFASDGCRIGYGGGYYDRFLKSCRAVTIGLAYDMQIFDWIPHDTEVDMPLDHLVTESRFINCNSRRP